MPSKLCSNLLAVSLAAVVGCATGTDLTDFDDQPITESGSGGSAAGGAGSGANANTSSTASTGAGGNGGMANDCVAPMHFCGGICSGNTPQTGCYQAVSCDPCPTPNNGSASCTMDGLCDVMCMSPYQKSGSNCVCSLQCCSNSDCANGETCENGACVAPCDPQLCIATCLIQMKVGVCQGNVCVCL